MKKKGKRERKRERKGRGPRERGRGEREMEAEEAPTVAAATKTKEEIEAGITKAMLSRLKDFKQQADNLTLEGVRRALEKDLGMERLSLDAHKKFIKQCLEKYFYGTGGENAAETEREVIEEPVQPNQEEIQIEEDIRDGNSGLDENSEGSPTSVERKKTDRETDKNNVSSSIRSEINEDMIKKAIRKRTPYFRSNLEITLGKVRSLLEGDLNLEKNSLDAFKKFISKELDTVLQSEVSIKTTNGTKKEPKKTSRRVATGKTSRGSRRTNKDLNSSDSDDVSSEDEEDEGIKKAKKRPAQRSKADTKVSKRQKTSTQRIKASGSGKKKAVESDSEKSDKSEGGKSSEGDHSQSSGEEEEVKEKSEKPAQIYGKRVERLKSIIKSCGMSVPPSVYKRVKQVPESKREGVLIKELEEILEREGLSTDPSEKEIKAVKKKKERAKDLEGIDMSNIVASSRRRTTSSFIPPPKPKIESASEEDEGGEEDDNQENEEDSDEEDNNDEDSSEASDGGEEEADEESD